LEIIISAQLAEGCMAANQVMVEMLAAPSMGDRCAADLPRPTEQAGR
jgi:hypothetical protein